MHSEGTTTRPDGASVVGSVVALPTMEREPGWTPERNAFELGRDYQRGRGHQRIEALEAEVEALNRRLDRLEAAL